MNNASRAIPLILEHEGGYVNHPDDPGGPTNRGITLATFRRYIKPNGTVADLRAMTEAQAIMVYKRDYWDAVAGDKLPAGLDYCMADYAVNSGPSRAAKALQQLVGVTPDGQIGAATLARLQNYSTESLIEAVCDQRLAFLKKLKTWDEFGRGWTKRVEAVRSTSLAWADALVPGRFTPKKERPGSVAGPAAIGIALTALFSAIAAYWDKIATWFGG